ncbi:hypothetical protein [Mucilaginibacter pedocola]|uniref:Uncharacterized protein n=1 Tax=Mucilaginibacter pedocola TaxID=1792845 RepID=A0A1S9PL92_9SPHI|nr:hypothetical protein [Mucilaginibacter pedocola]OOQ61740.1 hypothetical protein BC343_01330 [Mucilaginibacter pedocola]
MIPNEDIQAILFKPIVNIQELIDFADGWGLNADGDFKEIDWLNTPGPIYTTFTDNCGTGQVEAMNNVGADEGYHEVIFKQPMNDYELKETLVAAFVDPFGAYYFDGSRHWNINLIIEWWEKSDERLKYILERYLDELNLPKILNRPLYGPRSPIPENYKNWLDFYQNGMKEYLEWYIFKLSKQELVLKNLDFDWTRKKELDEILASRSTGF